MTRRRRDGPRVNVRARSGVLGLLIVGCLAGCSAARQSTRYRSSVETTAGTFAFEYTDADREVRRKLDQSVALASPRLAQWGGLREPVSIFILPTHEALEHAVDRHGYEWLRAWARYDEIFLQSPRTWSVFGAAQSEIDELMIHELTHTVMYQQAADRTHWARKGIPLWFREGMASWTAHQAYRWPTLEDLARFYERNPDADPIGDPEPLYQRESAIVYGAAHHAFNFLVKRYGKDQVRAVLAQMRGGDTFAEAFPAAVGLSQAAFVNDFKRYVRLRGFRGGRVRGMRPPPRPTERIPEPLPPALPPSGIPGQGERRSTPPAADDTSRGSFRARCPFP